jgi:hypothetical protein
MAGPVEGKARWRGAIALALAAAAFAAGSRRGGSAVEDLPGLAAWWRAEDSGADAVGGADAVLEGGAGYTEGRRGRAFSFDGIDDAATVADAPALNPTDGITLGAWVRIEDASSGQKPILVKPAASESSQPHYQYALAWYAPNASLGFYLGIGSTYSYVEAAGLDILGRWAHVAATYDGAHMRIYVDGTLRGSTPQTGSLPAVASPLHIGRYAQHAGNLLGALDEIVLFDRGLDGAEVMELAYPPPGAPTDLAALAVGGSRVDLSWADASDDETGFEIERDAGSGFEHLGTAPADAESWTDMTVVPASNYAYRLRAVNAGGASPWTGPVEVTTPPEPAFALERGVASGGGGAGRDRVDVEGAWGSGTGPWEPALPDDAEVRFAFEAGEATVSRTIPAGDPAWRRRGGRYRWRSPKGEDPRVAIDIDTSTGRWRVRVSRATLPAPEAAGVVVALDIGDAPGRSEEDWKGQGGGRKSRISFRAP